MRAHKWMLASSAILVVFLAFVITRSRSSDFAFLAGHEPLGPTRGVPLLAGTGPQAPIAYETAYAFPGKWQDVVDAADRQLEANGWEKSETDNSWTDDVKGKLIPHSAVGYRELSGMKRYVSIYQDCSKPDLAISSDLIESATFKKGWVAILVSRDPVTLSWKDSALHWARKVFYGAP